MNLIQARNVMWLRNNHRPLGELLDKGFLTRDRLEWAAQKAYVPELREAAKVLLASLDEAAKIKVDAAVPSVETKVIASEIEIGTSLEKARSTPWPYNINKGKPMGELLDSNQLTLKDLGYAVETAWDPRVKQAATALALIKLNQAVKEPVPSAGFVEVVSSGRSYSGRRQLSLATIQGVVLGVVLATIVVLSIWVFVDASRQSPAGRPLAEVVSTPGGIVTVILGLGFILGVAWLANAIVDWIIAGLEKQIEEHRRGQEGEEQVIQMLVQALDGSWRVFRNVVLPGRNKADLDLVLVGPPGIWVLEVKNLRGIYRNRGETWEYKNKRSWKAASTSPSKQALSSALRLANFMRADNLKVFVNAAVVWANASSPLQVDNPTVPIWHYRRLSDELGNIWHGEKLSKPEFKKIVDKLTRLCTDQKNANVRQR